MDWVIGISGTASSITVAVVIALWRRIHRMRENEFRHINDRLVAIEKKIDEHILWHLQKETAK